MKLYLFILLNLFILTSACKNSDIIRPGDSIELAYDKAINLYENEKYDDATDAFETIIRMGRGSDYAKNAQYYLAESYYNRKNYIISAAEYERFMSYYPQDEKREEVEYKRAMSYYNQSPRYRLDQNATIRAIRFFQLFNNNYPNSDLVLESAERINNLRSKLAHKIYEAANFYARTDSYLAATIYYDITIDQYPETKWAELALVDQIDTYNKYASKSVESKQIERYQKAIASYEKFLQLFPNSEYRADVEKLRDTAEASINKVREDLREQENGLTGVN